MIFNKRIEVMLNCCSGGASGSSSSSQSAPQLSPQALLQMYGTALPMISNIGANNISPINTSLATSAAEANPIYTASDLSQLGGMGGGYAGVGANLGNINDLLSAGILSSGGQALTNSAMPLLSQSNPVQSAANTQATNLINSINLNGLSGGEQDAVERSLNQQLGSTGNLGISNPTNLVSNAMQFGNALQAKRAALAGALSTGTGVAANQNNIFNPVNTALTNPGTTNFGLGQFNPNQANGTITSPLSYGTSIFAPLAANASSQKSSGASNSSSFNFGI